MPLGPFQDHCLRRIAEGESWSELAARCGYRCSSERPYCGDTSALKRRLGLLPNSACRGYGPTTSKSLNYETAVRLARGLDLDPVDVGI